MQEARLEHEAETSREQSQSEHLRLTQLRARRLGRGAKVFEGHARVASVVLEHRTRMCAAIAAT